MSLISLEDQRQSFYQSRYNKRKNFEGELHIREADFQAFQTNGHMSHTCVGPKKIKWHRAPRSLNPSLHSGIYIR